MDHKNLKNKRIYNDELFNISNFIIIEFIALITESLEKDYNVFHIKTNATYSLDIPKKDLDFMMFDYFDVKNNNNNFEVDIENFKNLNESYQYSENTITLKRQIAKDISKIFMHGYINKETLNSDSNIGAMFSIPFLIDNKITYEFLIISKKKFNIDVINNTEFSTFKITSINSLVESNLSYSFFDRLFNMRNFTFFNSFFEFKNPTDIVSESIPIIQILNIKKNNLTEEFDIFKNNLNKLGLNKKSFKEKLISDKRLKIIHERAKLNDDIFEIQVKKMDLDFVLQLYFSVICFQFHVFNEDLVKDWYAITSLCDEILFDKNISKNGNKIIINEKFLQQYTFYGLHDTYNVHELPYLEYRWFKIKLNKPREKIN